MSDADNTRIYNILDDIRRELSEMNDRLGRRAGEAESRLNIIEQLRADCRTEVVSMHKALRGNGTQGWFRRVEALEAVAGMQSKWFWVAVMSGQSVLVASVASVIARML